MFGSLLGFALGGAALSIGIHWWATRGTASGPRLGGRLPRVLLAANLLCVVVLIVTSFPVALAGEGLRGWRLLIHVTVAGAWVVLLPVLAVRTLCEAIPGRRGLWALFLLGALLTIAPMLLAMTPRFGQAGLASLLQMHRYGSLALTSVTVVLVYVTITERRPS